MAFLEITANDFGKCSRPSTHKTAPSDPYESNGAFFVDRRPADDWQNLAVLFSSSCVRSTKSSMLLEQPVPGRLPWKEQQAVPEPGLFLRTVEELVHPQRHHQPVELSPGRRVHHCSSSEPERRPLGHRLRELERSSCCRPETAGGASEVSIPKTDHRHCCSRFEPVCSISEPVPACSISEQGCSTLSQSFQRTENRPEPGRRSARKLPVPHTELQYVASDFSWSVGAFWSLPDKLTHTRTISQHRVTQTLRDANQLRRAAAVHWRYRAPEDSDSSDQADCTV